MKETTKASIGGYAFTLDTDAYEALEKYLNDLKEYFGKKDDGSEILNDIEYRMSELLRLKVDAGSKIVTAKDAIDIIKIMGNPADFGSDDDTEPGEGNVSESKKKERPWAGKKLYRNKDNAVLGGVCSGLGQYFQVDPVVVRAIYGLSFFIAFTANNIFEKLGLIIFVSYILLWIAMPAAKTFKQKLAMSGHDPSIEGIEYGNIKVKKMRGSRFGRILKKALKVSGSGILYFTAFLILVCAFFVLFLPSSADLPSVKDFLEANGLYTGKITLALSLFWLVPTIMIIYVAIKLLTKFTSKDFIALGIAFIVWIGACIYIGTVGVRIGKHYNQKASEKEMFTQELQSDTIHIRLDKKFKTSDNLFNSNEVYMINENPKEWFIIPEIQLKQDSVYKDIKIEIEKTAFASNLQVAEDNAKNARLNIRKEGSTLIVSPQLYSKNNIWNRELFKITVYSPLDKTIILEKPLSTKTSYNKKRKKMAIGVTYN